MKGLAILAILVLSSCGPKPGTPVVSKEPISVRGWIVDVDHGENANFRTVETEAARKAALFRATNVWVENAPYVSGGVAETGAFLLLDVPPGTVTIEFSAPGAPAARLRLEHIPGNADVFLPGLLLKKDSVALTEPAAVKVRMAARVQKATPSGAFATIAGQRIPVLNTPIAELIDRHEYPNAPSSGATPLATVK